jgi:hypothetical protein
MRLAHATNMWSCFCGFETKRFGESLGQFNRSWIYKSCDVQPVRYCSCLLRSRSDFLIQVSLFAE